LNISEEECKTAANQNAPCQGDSLWSLFLTFLKIGSTAFGGFMALISVVQNYAVERKKLLRHEDMLNGISLATILPGPVAVNVVAYTGYRIRGGIGAIVCTFGVILPSFLLLLGLSYAYFNYGQIPAVGKFFKGFIPAVAAIILVAAWNMGIKTIKGFKEALIAAAALGLLLSVGGFAITLLIIVASGLAGWLFLSQGAGLSHQKNVSDNKNKKKEPQEQGAGKKLLGLAPVAAAPFLSMEIALAAKLLAVFAGMSLLLFGGGYVFIPLIQEIVVDGNGWVTQKEFVDGIALGQVTPGPILISAAFIGYKVGGILGAAAATAGIFAPPAILMIASTRFFDRIKHSKNIGSGLRGIRSAVIGMIAGAAFVVGRTADPTWVSLLIFGASLVALFRFKIDVAWIIPAAGIIGILLY
jgi:chromate transporter